MSENSGPANWTSSSPLSGKYFLHFFAPADSPQADVFMRFAKLTTRSFMGLYIHSLNCVQAEIIVKISICYILKLEHFPPIVTG